MEQNRFKSPVVWAAVFAQIITILMSSGLINYRVSEAAQIFLSCLLQALAILGVLNNPTDQKRF